MPVCIKDGPQSMIEYHKIGNVCQRADSLFWQIIIENVECAFSSMHFLEAVHKRAFSPLFQNQTLTLLFELTSLTLRRRHILFQFFLIFLWHNNRTERSRCSSPSLQIASLPVFFLSYRVALWKSSECACYHWPKGKYIGLNRLFFFFRFVSWLYCCYQSFT